MGSRAWLLRMSSYLLIAWESLKGEEGKEEE